VALRIFKNYAQGLFHTTIAVWNKAAEPPLSPNQRCAAARVTPATAKQSVAMAPGVVREVVRECGDSVW
jgi:hypothetical protein